MDKTMCHETEWDPIDERVYRLACQKFHLQSLYPYQELVIRTILERGGLYGDQRKRVSHRNQIVVLPTGSGKSVCFMLPALLLPGLTVVVYPLLSLMNDQGRRVEALGATAVFLRGGQGTGEREQVWNQLEAGTTRFVITNPETLNNRNLLERLSRFSISLLVIDEVHTVTQWGDTFRPAYLELASIIKRLAPDQVIAFTATASPRIIERITHILFDGILPNLVKGDPDRPNISYRVMPSIAKMHDLEMLVRHTVSLPVVVFCSTRKRCESYAWELKRRLPNLSIRYYHAGLDKREREATEAWFYESTAAILFSTSAYGMGVDKKHIRTVVHLDLSGDIESFLQESGRAGRDGEPAESIVLLGLEEWIRSKQEHASSPFNRLAAVFRQHSRCYREALLELMGFQNETCSGCDVCDKRVLEEADGTSQILTLCRLYPLRFTGEKASHVLAGTRSTPYCSRIDQENPLFGVLQSWKIDDVKEAVEILIEQGQLYKHRNWWWKGRISSKFSRTT
jgi:ATP-dependent DNA helicase RecQ